MLLLCFLFKIWTFWKANAKNLKGLPLQKELQCEITGGIFLSLMREGVWLRKKLGLTLWWKSIFGWVMPSLLVLQGVFCLPCCCCRDQPYPAWNSNSLPSWAAFTHIHVPEVFQVFFRRVPAGGWRALGQGGNEIISTNESRVMKLQQGHLPLDQHTLAWSISRMKENNMNFCSILYKMRIILSE